MKSPLLRTAYLNRDHRSQLKRVLTCIALVILSLLSVEAADKYVRKGATGTGTGADWTNAYTEFNQVTTSGLPGFAVYVAAGTYTTNLPTFNNIDNWTLKRATIASHGASTGWNNAYDGQVTHTGGKFLFLNGCDNVIIDGGGTKEPWLFRVVGQNSPPTGSSRSRAAAMSPFATSTWMATDVLQVQMLKMGSELAGRLTSRWSTTGFMTTGIAAMLIPTRSRCRVPTG